MRGIVFNLEHLYLCYIDGSLLDSFQFIGQSGSYNWFSIFFLVLFWKITCFVTTQNRYGSWMGEGKIGQMIYCSSETEREENKDYGNFQSD